MINELDEIGEITFVHKGKVGVGFEINRMKKVVVTFIDKCVIGGFYASFNQRSNYIYCAVSDIEGYFIRRSTWLDILEEYSNIGIPMKKKILIDYFFKLRFRLQLKKDLEIRNFMDRYDYQ